MTNEQAISIMTIQRPRTGTKEKLEAYDMAIKALEQEPKMGEWMHPYKSDIACECSECHMQMPIANYFNYCPNCGAKMEVTADADSD